MSQQNPGQMIQPTNALRLKVGGGRLGAIDPAAIAKAEAALKSLASNFTQWLADEISKLDAARQQVHAQGATSETMENLYLRAHDLKGLGTTYGYQLITRIAGSLCRLIDDKEKRASTSLELVDAHIDAIKAAIRDDIKSDEHPVGQTLVEELERRVKAKTA
jgi:chemotaxis protein histidine kinase CheA